MLPSVLLRVLGGSPVIPAFTLSKQAAQVIVKDAEAGLEWAIVELLRLVKASHA